MSNFHAAHVELRGCDNFAKCSGKLFSSHMNKTGNRSCRLVDDSAEGEKICAHCQPQKPIGKISRPTHEINRGGLIA